MPVVRVNALGALNGEAQWEKGILELMEAVDSYIPMPQREIDKPFLMPIEDIFSIQGRGTVVTGRIERGHREGRRGNGDRGLPGDAQDGGDRRGDVQEAAWTKGGPGTTWGCCCAAWRRTTWSAGR